MGNATGRLTDGSGTLSRRGFAALAGAALAGGAVTGCLAGRARAEQEAPRALPAPDPETESGFCISQSVNIDNLDAWLDIPGVVKRDLRMLLDPADYGAIGGDPKLSITVEGFKVVPYPFVGTLAPLPVAGAYEGPALFDVTWGDGLTVLDAAPRYTQSLQIVEELFPRDAPILLMCGGGGYAAMMRALLIYLGWDPEKLYNVGGAWGYLGDHVVQLATMGDDPDYFFWRADVATIDFATLKPLN